MTGPRSTPLFLQQAEAIAARMSDEPSPAGARIARRASELASQFARWMDQPPSQQSRIEGIALLCELHRQAMDYLDDGIPPPSTRRPGLC